MSANFGVEGDDCAGETGLVSMVCENAVVMASGVSAVVFVDDGF